MKKTAFISAFAMCMLASCGGNKQQANNSEVVEEEKSFEQTQIEGSIKQQLDSLSSEFSKMGNTPFMAALKEGRIELSEQEKQVKPEYLIDPASTNELVTLSQKYRAISILNADKTIANAYGMPTDEYEVALKKMIVDIEDPAFKVFLEGEDSDPSSYSTLVENFYKAEDENGRINFFWEATTAFMVEELYIISQDSNEKFLQCFNDESAANVTYRIILFQDALERLKEYNPEIAGLCASIKPLEQLNAVNVDQLKEQLSKMNAQLKDIRNGLLK